ncbi:unnamed protein product [Rhizoctonia solani]|uniref:F-box domain-containing protein n=1 Tax=Rhizoctonia solani TaxID=456999 RepID=A0A8H3C7R9_9AGAM|nr:unnamed protein product [Rhizoctonia solani]
MFDISSSTYATVRKWEEAGVSLSIALVKYIELSASLGKQSLAEGVPTEFLTTRIDAALASLHNNLGQQLSQTRSVLAQTRNQILSPLHRFPEEILSEIFMHVVFAPQNLPHHEDPKSMRLCIIRVYRALHALMSVCTMWRNTALNRGALWSVVPHLDWPMDPSNEKATIELMMHRAKGTSLKLAVDLRDEPKDTSLLVQHISRFDSMSIVTSSNNNIRDILELFTGQFEVEPLLLSRLSLYRRRVSYGQLSGDAILRSTSEQRAFNRLIQQLTTLQLRHVFFHWDTIKLSSYLTMLHLQEIDLGGDRQIIHLLNALSSAKQLRELTIIKIKTYRARLPIENIPTRCIILLPNLQWLLIQDLYFNTLHLLLSSIQSRSHQLSIIFTRKSLQYRFQHGDASDDLDIDVV